MHNEKTDPHDYRAGCYYIQVDKVTFVKSTSSIGIPIDVYEISGTCRSKMSEFSGANEKQLENGKFNMLIARRTDQ